jgi:hypothetical protein
LNNKEERLKFQKYQESYSNVAVVGLVKFKMKNNIITSDVFKNIEILNE